MTNLATASRTQILKGKKMEKNHTISPLGLVLLVYIHAQALVLALSPPHRHSGTTSTPIENININKYGCEDILRFYQKQTLLLISSLVVFSTKYIIRHSKT